MKARLDGAFGTVEDAENLGQREVLNEKQKQDVAVLCIEAIQCLMNGRGIIGRELDWWKGMGHTNVWAPMSLDADRGLLYLPVSTPSNNFYGVKRPGDILFGDVCLDAATGKRKWHYQITHHGLWDYDPSGAPILATITVDGKKIDAVVQLTKQG